MATMRFCSARGVRGTGNPLGGNYSGFRECHVQPDWLLIYTVDHQQLILVAARTGSHSDLLDLKKQNDDKQKRRFFFLILLPS